MQSVSYLAIGLLSFSAIANAANVNFNADPFAGTDALTTPGRQVIGNEFFIANFDVANDVFVLNKDLFGVNDILFLNDLSSNVPASGVNTIVLQNSDVPFMAGIAADRIAEQITDPGAGFFIYFNSGLDLPRLVYSTDLSDPTADLKVLARLENLSGPGGRAQLPNFTAANFTTVVPEPSTLLLTAAGALLIGASRLRRARPNR